MKMTSQLTRLTILFCLLMGCGSATSTQSSTVAPTGAATAQPTSEATVQLGNWHDMIYHEGVGKVVLVNGGPESGKVSEDPVELWTWDGSRWTLLSADANGPRWRNFASIAYDSKRDVLVLYGGLTAVKEFQDTWEWDGETWTQLPAEGPGLREAAGMTYDTKREKIVLFGGAQSGTMKNDLWEWNGSHWTLVSTEGPSPRFPAGFVYDAANGYVLLFGGHSFENQSFMTFGDTWTWNGTTWEPVETDGPSARDGARGVYVPTFEYILLFGGAEITTNIQNLNDTWVWDGRDWEELDTEGPPARVHPVMAFDPEREVIVMTGGSNGPNATLSDTWEWDGESWACKGGCQ